MTTLIIFMLFMNAGTLILAPGTMCQGLGGITTVIDEGLSAFNNPACTEGVRYTATVSRWLYATTVAACGASMNHAAIGLSYLNYGSIQGYDANGVTTNTFVPYSAALGLGIRIGVCGFSVKMFYEDVDTYTMVGLCGSIGTFVKSRHGSLGIVADGFGKEFAHSSALPVTIKIGLQRALPADFSIYAETRLPHPELHLGMMYRYEHLQVLLGAQYLKSGNIISGTTYSIHFSDIQLMYGMVISVDQYTIGYAFVYSEFSNAHTMSVTMIR